VRSLGPTGNSHTLSPAIIHGKIQCLPGGLSRSNFMQEGSDTSYLGCRNRDSGPLVHLRCTLYLPRSSVQPFLTPVPANAPPTLKKVLQPLIYSFAIVRGLLCVIVLAENFVLQSVALLLVCPWCAYSLFIDLLLVVSTQFHRYTDWCHGCLRP
jgi:hypothetical protein